jgi:hypothetical protein
MSAIGSLAAGPLLAAASLAREVTLWVVSCRSRVALWGAMDDSMPEPPNDNTTGSRGHMDQHAQNDWGSVQYDNRFDEYWVTAGSARQSLFYCPWCGEKLPASKRNAWFDAVEALGVDPWGDQVPVEFRSDAWWKQSGG